MRYFKRICAANKEICSLQTKGDDFASVSKCHRVRSGSKTAKASVSSDESAPDCLARLLPIRNGEANLGRSGRSARPFRTVLIDFRFPFANSPISFDRFDAVN